MVGDKNEALGTRSETGPSGLSPEARPNCRVLGRLSAPPPEVNKETVGQRKSRQTPEKNANALSQKIRIGFKHRNRGPDSHRQKDGDRGCGQNPPDQARDNLGYRQIAVPVAVDRDEMPQRVDKAEVKGKRHQRR